MYKENPFPEGCRIRFTSNWKNCSMELRERVEVESARVSRAAPAIRNFKICSIFALKRLMVGAGNGIHLSITSRNGKI